MKVMAITAMAAAALGVKDGQVLRKLGHQESMWHTMYEESKPYGCSLLTYSLVVDCKRRLEAQDVQMALEALQRQVPILRVRVENQEGGKFVVASNARPCLTVLPPGGNWLEEHLDKANHEQVYNGPNGPHWKVALLQEPANTAATPSSFHRAVLCMSIPHTFTDGLSQGLVLGNMLRNLDQVILKGEIEHLEPEPLNSSLEELLNEKVPLSTAVVRKLCQAMMLIFRERKSSFLKAYVAEYEPEFAKDSPCGMVTRCLAPEQLTRLREKCRQHGVSVNAAVSAAVSIAGARMLAKTPDGQTHSGPYVLRTMFPVNLRRYVSGKVDKSQLYGTFVNIAGSYVYVPSTSTSSFWPVASNINASTVGQLKMHMPLVVTQRIIPRIFKLDNWNFEKEIEKASKQKFWPVDYNVNNIGSLDSVFPKTTAVRAVELHRTYRQHPAFEFSFGSHLFQTVGGRLCYDLNYMRGRVRHEDAERFQTLAMDVLEEVAAAE